VRRAEAWRQCLIQDHVVRLHTNMPVREGDEVPPVLRTVVGMLRRGRDVQHEVRKERLRTGLQDASGRVATRG
jgi:hypothetical protein